MFMRASARVALAISRWLGTPIQWLVSTYPWSIARQTVSQIECICGRWLFAFCCCFFLNFFIHHRYVLLAKEKKHWVCFAKRNYLPLYVSMYILTLNRPHRYVTRTNICIQRVRGLYQPICDIAGLHGQHFSNIYVCVCVFSYHH